VKFLKNAKNKILLKIKWILNAEIQANRGANFLHLTCQGGGEHPCHPRQLHHWISSSAKYQSSWTLPLQKICGVRSADSAFSPSLAHKDCVTGKGCLHFRKIPQEHWLINKDYSRHARNYNEKIRPARFAWHTLLNIKMCCLHSWFYWYFVLSKCAITGTCVINVLH